MNILVVGLGVIGTIYGYVFQSAGHDVEHHLRPNSPKRSISKIDVDMLDGRFSSQGEHSSDTYMIRHCERASYDFIFVSVPTGGIADVIGYLNDEHIAGTIILCCGTWEDRAHLEELMQGREYVLGYPVAGGNIRGDVLRCCIFDHFMLEGESRAAISNYADLRTLFADCRISFEHPHDMLEWIWLHMAINAGVVSAAGMHGDVNDAAASAERLMGSSKLLSEAVVAIRETLRIVASRGVELRYYKNELLAYRLPTFISAPVMKRMFARNVLSRKIMTLHSNTDDLMFVCRSVYECGKANNVAAPVFYKNYEGMLDRLAPAGQASSAGRTPGA